MPQSSGHLDAVEQPMVSSIKKAYQTPHLRDYGDLREMTQTNAAGTRADAGTPPNIYTS